MLEIKRFELGLIIQANCYVVSENGHALIIDPGSKGRGVQKYIEDHNLSVDAVLLTHGHFDPVSYTHLDVYKRQVNN